jgi:hypothetical protein
MRESKPVSAITRYHAFVSVWIEIPHRRETSKRDDRRTLCGLKYVSGFTHNERRIAPSWVRGLELRHSSALRNCYHRIYECVD